jgi:flavin reductase (DIM6/NTAB) family NADH-FMN oxidoreductase RutF
MSLSKPELRRQTSAGREAVAVQVFREAMCRLASGVTIITASLQGAPVGMTATAVCSVSAKPPLLLISLTAGTRTAMGVEERNAFAVHLLPYARQKYAEQFASPGDHFAEIAHRCDPTTGVPILEDVLGHFLCEVERSVVVADHVLFVGRVVECAIKESGRAPLVYFDRCYGKIAAGTEREQGSLEPWGSGWDIGLPGWGIPT